MNRQLRIRTRLKHEAFDKLVEAGVIEKNAAGRIDPTGFQRFWDDFEPVVDEFLKNEIGRMPPSQQLSLMLDRKKKNERWERIEEAVYRLFVVCGAFIVPAATLILILDIVAGIAAAVQ